MPSNPSINIISPTSLLDAAFLSIGNHLTASLSWLTTAYGKAEKLTRMKDGRQSYYPAVYAANKEYLKMLPDDNLGNFCFFLVEDGYQLDKTPARYVPRINTNCRLVFWFDFREVFTDWTHQSAQNVIEQVLNALNSISDVNIKKLLPITVWEETDNIYRGFDHNEIENQFKMRPYGGFAIDFELSYEDGCNAGQRTLQGVDYWTVNVDNIVQ